MDKDIRYEEGMRMLELDATTFDALHAAHGHGVNSMALNDRMVVGCAYVYKRRLGVDGYVAEPILPASPEPEAARITPPGTQELGLSHEQFDALCTFLRRMGYLMGPATVLVCMEEVDT